MKIIEYPGIPQCPDLWHEEGKPYGLLNEILILMLVTECSRGFQRVRPQGSLLGKVLRLSEAQRPHAEPATH